MADTASTLWLGKEIVSGSETSEVKNLKQQITHDNIPFQFGITDDGQYGYYKQNSNKVTPFASSQSGITEYDATLWVRSCYPDKNMVYVDISNINEVKYAHLSANGTDGSSVTLFKTFDWTTLSSTDSEDDRQTITLMGHGPTWSDDPQTTINTSNYVCMKISEGRSKTYGATAFSADSGKVFDHIVIASESGYSEVCYLPPIDKGIRMQMLEYTDVPLYCKAKIQSVIADNNTPLTSSFLFTDTVSAIDPVLVTYKKNGRYFWITGASSSSKYKLDMKLVDYPKDNQTFIFYQPGGDISRSSSVESNRGISIDISDDNYPELKFTRSAETECAGTLWEASGTDWSNYSAIEIDISVLSTIESEYKNLFGLCSQYPGQNELGSITPIESYDTRYQRMIELPNEVCSHRKLKLDVSDITLRKYMKITAGSAEFVIHSIKFVQ